VRFKDRVVIVTGGGRGIGAATVRRFAEDGAAVVIADLDEEPARELAAEVEAGGGRALAVGCDVSQRASVEALFAAAIKRFGQVDIAVLCAGILRFNLVQDVSEDEWDAVIDTHLKGMFLCAQGLPQPALRVRLSLLTSPLPRRSAQLR
jgi:NAD(P)-dependent dehydrogenase (short-subunit alcohol dehydrogenase family)